MKSLMTMSCAILTLVFASGCMTKRVDMTDIPLAWQPTTDMKQVSGLDFDQLAKSSLKVENLTDVRTIQPKTRIGEYSEDKANVLYVNTSSDAALFVTSGLKDSLGKAGVKVDEGSSKYVLSGQLKQFYVTEENTYQGRILMELSLKKDGKVVWSGLIDGKNSRFGRTFKVENYMESLSDSVVDASVNLLKNDGFAKNWK